MPKVVVVRPDTGAENEVVSLVLGRPEELALGEDDAGGVGELVVSGLEGGKRRSVNWQQRTGEEGREGTDSRDMRKVPPAVNGF